MTLQNILPALIAELALREPAVQKREEEALQSSLKARKQWQRDKARDYFNLCVAWNELHQLMSDWKSSLSKEKLTYVVDSWFLQDLIRYLTPGRDEEICY